MLEDIIIVAAHLDKPPKIVKVGFNLAQLLHEYGRGHRWGKSPGKPFGDVKDLRNVTK